MAIPASGSLSICATAGACRSISTAVGTGSGSLAALSVSAGKGAPHGMVEFYNYVPKIDIDMVQYGSAFGTQGISSYVYRNYCLVPTPAAGQTYTLCLRPDICWQGQQAGSYGQVCITCNLTMIYCCRVTSTACITTPGVLRTIDSTDCIRIYTCACATNTACQGASGVGAQACIFSVTGTYHQKGTTCTLAGSCTG